MTLVVSYVTPPLVAVVDSQVGQFKPTLLEWHVHVRHARWMTPAAAALIIVPALTAFSSPVAAAATTGPISGAGTGELPSYTLLSHPLSDRAALEVNPATGNLIVRSTDVAVRGTGLSYSLVRYWNSLATGAGAFGNGGSANNGTDVRLTPNSDGSVTYTGPSGFSVKYTSNGSGGYTTPTSYTTTQLTKNADGTYTLKLQRNDEALTFSSGGQLTTDADRNGNAEHYAYNSDGTLAQVTDSQGKVTSFAYESGRIHQTTDPALRHVVYTYDSNGNLTKVSDGTQALWQFSYLDGNGNLNQIVDPRNNTTTLAYDSTHRVTAITYADYTSAAAKTTYAYTSGTTTVTDPLGHATTYSIDSSNRVTATKDALGNQRQAGYDGDSNVTSSTDPSAAVSNYTYGTNDALATIQQPTQTGGGAGATTTLTYGSSHPYLPATVTDPQGNSLHYSYDSSGNLTSATPYGSDGKAVGGTTGYTRAYQSSTTNCGAKPGELCSETDPRGSKTTYGYDNLGNVNTITPPAPLGRQTLTYDALSRVATVTNGNGITTTYSYDGDDRITKLAYSDGTSVSYGYDADGNLTSRADATGSTTYSYDATNHLTYKTPPVGYARHYTYDLAGNLLTSDDTGGPAGTTTYGYDAANENTSVKDSTGATTTLTYKMARPTTTTYPGGVTQTLGYDASGRATSITGTGPAGTLTKQTGSYANAGKDTELLQSVSDTVAGTTTAYTYDGQNRLTVAQVTGSSSHYYGYTYDAAGNRTSSVFDGTYSATDTFNAADELTQRGGATFGGYDPLGDATSDGTGQAYAYNAQGQTTGLTPPGQASISATYSDADQSERTVFGGTASVNGVLGDDQDTTAGATTYYVRTAGGSLVSERTNSGTYYYLYDLHGSVVGLTNSSGARVDTYSYDPYGQLTSQASAAPVGNPWRFSAGYYDTATKLYHYGQRYYDPSLGRWTQRDALAGVPSDPNTVNRFIYAGDDPTNNSDPTGFFSFSLGFHVCAFGGCLGAQVGVDDKGNASVGGSVGTGSPGTGVDAVVDPNGDYSEHGAHGSVSVSCSAGPYTASDDSAGGTGVTAHYGFSTPSCSAQLNGSENF